MSILVVGSVAFDTLKTPFGVREKIMGGAATYFSLAASFFTDVRVVGVVGEDRIGVLAFGQRRERLALLVEGRRAPLIADRG